MSLPGRQPDFLFADTEFSIYSFKLGSRIVKPGCFPLKCKEHARDGSPHLSPQHSEQADPCELKD